MANKRKRIPVEVTRSVLLEAGYRCAVPTCRGILALDLHHLVQVSADGGNTVVNLVALCPTCHALHHRKTIPVEAIRAYKAMTVSLSQAFDLAAIDQLLFLSKLQPRTLGISGDGVLTFHRLIGAGLAGFGLITQNGPLLVYEVFLTDVGRAIVDAWSAGHVEDLQRALALMSESGETADQHDGSRSAPKPK